MVLPGYTLATTGSVTDRKHSKISCADLMKRNIFEPMGMNYSHFLATDENRHLIVVPPLSPEVAVSPHHPSCLSKPN